MNRPIFALILLLASSAQAKLNHQINSREAHQQIEAAITHYIGDRIDETGSYFLLENPAGSKPRRLRFVQFFKDFAPFGDNVVLAHAEFYDEELGQKLDLEFTVEFSVGPENVSHTFSSLPRGSWNVTRAAFYRLISQSSPKQ